jgi:hypothetical protein
MNQPLIFRSIEDRLSRVQLVQRRGEGGTRTRESNLHGDKCDVLAAETETVGGERVALVLAGRELTVCSNRRAVQPVKFKVKQ